MLLKNCRYIITQNENRDILENKDIRLAETIEEIGDITPRSGEQVIDCKGLIAMPGLINSHTHAAMYVMRGFSEDMPLFDWLNRNWKVEDKYDYNIEYNSSKMAFQEMVSTGTTACLDMWDPDGVIEAARDVGIRLKAGYVVINDKLEEDKVKDLISKAELPVIQPHAVYTVSEEYLVKSKELADRYKVDLHIHASETREEVFECKKKTGKLPVEYLDSIGFLDKNVILAHLGWVANWEIELIKQRGAKVVHCPASNMKLATGGFFPYKEFKDREIVVGLGTDGPVSNNSLDMFREMRMMALKQKDQYWDPSIKAQDVLDTATVNGAKIIGIKAGRISQGYLADIVLLKPNIHMLPLYKNNLISNLVYSATGDAVVKTIINGRIVYDGHTDYSPLDNIKDFISLLKNFK
ncbi:hypothetical protein DRN75_01225 [Nanoarchaeota archaeon]|nr:MAG: hypothetical protein DRN75_01225 [Nanoarchaeota archaeon]